MRQNIRNYEKTKPKEIMAGKLVVESILTKRQFTFATFKLDTHFETTSSIQVAMDSISKKSFSIVFQQFCSIVNRNVFNFPILRIILGQFHTSGRRISIYFKLCVSLIKNCSSAWSSQ